MIALSPRATTLATCLLLSSIAASTSPSEPSALREVPDPTLAAEIERVALDATYSLVPAPDCGWRAPAPAQSMETVFAEGGVRVQSAADAVPDHPWWLGLELTGWGRGHTLAQLPPASPRVRGRSAEYVRGPVVEWFVNHPQGLQQGLLVEHAPPTAAGADAGALTLDFALTGELRAEVLLGGRDALFLDRDGRPLARYEGLQVFDADGVELEAWLEARDGRLAIRIDDRGARYPLHVDPWVKNEEAKFTAGVPAVTEQFGSVLSLSGDTAAVGAPGSDVAGLNAGAAYVFVRSGSAWTQQQQLFGSDTVANDLFGQTVAVDGDTLVVGAGGSDQAGTNRGAAYVFTRSGTVWTEQAKLTAADAEDGDFLGVAVALEGDTALVGTRSAEGEAITPGGLTHDPISGLIWAADSSVLAEIDPVKGFATVIGAIGFSQVEGLAYDPVGDVLYGSDNATDQLITIDPLTGAGTAVGLFGLSFTRVNGLAFDSVTGTLYGADAASDQLLVIDTITGGASVVGPLGFAGVQGLDFDSTTGTLYGTDVALDQLITIDTVTGAGTAVGPLGFGAVRGLAYDTSGAILYGSDVTVTELLLVDTGTGMTTSAGSFRGEQTGSAYVFTRSGSLWTEEARLLASDKTAGGKFAQAVALSGDTALLGSEGDGQNGSSAGAAYAFRRSGSTWTEEQKLLASDGTTGDQFGAAVALVDDVAAVGAARDDLSGGFDQGSAYVFTRSGSTWTQAQKLTSSEAADQDLFGSSLALSDNTLVVGTRQADLVGGFDQGAAYAFVLSGTWLEFQKFIASDAQSSDGLGWSVAIEGDTALLGAPLDDHAPAVPGSINGQGSVYQYEVCPAPVNYCTAGVSASGCQAAISSSGVPSGTNASGFFLIASSVEGSKDGLFFFGANGRQGNAWGNGTSFQCVLPPVFRGGLLLGTGTDGQCDGSFAQDLNALWCPSCPKPLKNPGIGATIQAQLWYRDPLSTSSQTTSLSDALEFCVGP